MEIQSSLTGLPNVAIPLTSQWAEARWEDEGGSVVDQFPSNCYQVRRLGLRQECSVAT